jgi:hypothetical protein
MCVSCVNELTNSSQIQIGVSTNYYCKNRPNLSSDPAHDLQAMDRAYRFGQTRDVSVFRLLGAGSVEELIYARQLYKQQQMTIGYDASIQTRFDFSKTYLVLY